MRKRWGNRDFIHHQICLHHFLGLPSSRQKAPKKKNQYLRALGHSSVSGVLAWDSYSPELHPSTSQRRHSGARLESQHPGDGAGGSGVEGHLRVCSRSDLHDVLPQTDDQNNTQLNVWIGLISYLFIKTYLFAHGILSQLFRWPSGWSLLNIWIHSYIRQIRLPAGFWSSSSDVIVAGAVFCLLILWSKLV